VDGRLYKSTDGGATFGPLPIRTTVYGFPNLALGAPGEVWAVGRYWHEYPGGVINWPGPVNTGGGCAKARSSSLR